MLDRLRRHGSTRLLALLVVLFVSTAQALELGALSLAHMPAHTMSSVTFSRAPLAFTSFARAVGGVAFTTKALSADGSSVRRLIYDQNAPDGSRLIAEIRRSDGSTGHYTVDAPDWIHVPLARFVASGSEGAVTLFGALRDKVAQQELQQRGAMIANFHPTLENTLLGLRLLQADMIAFEENATDLFRDNGQYILGAMESAPSAAQLKANAEHFRRVSAWVERQPERYTSYVTGDVGSKVRYSISDGKLRLVGEPVWYCWRHDQKRVEAVIARHAANLSADAFVLLSISRFDERVKVEYETLAKKVEGGGTGDSGASFLLMRRAASVALRKLAEAIVERPVGSADQLTIVSKQKLSSALASGDEAAVKSLIETASSIDKRKPQKAELLTAEIQSIMPAMAAEIESIPFVQMTEYSDQFSRLIRSEQGINPTVYRALQTSVRVAALMRAAKEENGQAFSQLVSSVARVTPHIVNPPGYKLTTPTVYPR